MIFKNLWQRKHQKRRVDGKFGLSHIYTRWFTFNLYAHWKNRPEKGKNSKNSTQMTLFYMNSKQICNSVTFCFTKNSFFAVSRK